jgi:CheY-like chemotaxis protein
VVTDNSMPGMSGAEMAHIIKLRSPATPVVMYSGTVPPDQACLDTVILRPSHLLGLKDAIENVLAS